MRALGVACACLAAAATAAAQNLLTNGSFDGGLSGWNYPGYTSIDWTLDATGGGSSGSAKAVIPATYSRAALGQCVAVQGGVQYTAGGKVLIPTGQASTGAVWLFVQFLSSTDCNGGFLIEAETPELSATTGWEQVDTGAVTAPSTARTAYLAAWVDNHGAADFKANFDDMFLVAGTIQRQRWIPAVIHKDVPSKNAKWRSDVAILNRSDASANLTITMHATAGSLSKTYSTAANSQILIPDVAGWLGAVTDSGPLEVVSDQGFFLSARTYNQVDSTHTYGQDYEGLAPSEAVAAGESAWLPQLTENSFYRTNVGIANTGPASANVTLTLYDAAGTQVWQDSRDYAAGGFYQYQQPYLAFGGTPSGYAKVTVNSGSGVVAYASVVDAATGDPTTITMKR